MALIEPKIAYFPLCSLLTSIAFGCSNEMRVDGTKSKEVKRNGDQP
ncbi:hypothetical protein PS928_03623 [Pseudomonas fluorescens]|uniref:Lipoprotein n=1 Tax=Pseudomonas fluorescens TaxID=294 RepID=A0A5E7UH01_PSEFL|nr:hypothetical protein PS928_03623 [Pseudomonas fluorescens]